MKRVLFIVLYLSMGLVAWADAPPSPPPVSVYLYPVAGSPPVLHLHGVTGEVHLYWMLAPPIPSAPPKIIEPMPPAKQEGKAYGPEEQKLDALRKLVNTK